MASEIEILVELLPWLVANNGASTKEVADRFNITEAKVLDLMQLLVLTGPDQGGGGLVDIDFEDRDSLFVFDAKDFDKPVQLTNFEANSILGGLHYLQQVVEGSTAVEIGSLIEKIAAKLPGVSSPLEVVPNLQSKDFATVIQTAISKNRLIVIEYASATSGVVASRIIEPMSISAIEDHLYLSAWCRNTDDMRTFRLDRIVSIEVKDEIFEIRSVDETPRNTALIDAKLLVNSRFAREIDRTIISGQTSKGEDLIELDVRVHSLEWLSGVVIWGGGDCTVIEPPALRDLVLRRLSSWANR